MLRTSKPLEKATDGNVPHVRRLQRFQIPCDDDILGCGMQVWSYHRVMVVLYCNKFFLSKTIDVLITGILIHRDCIYFCRRGIQSPQLTVSISNPRVRSVALTDFSESEKLFFFLPHF